MVSGVRFQVSGFRCQQNLKKIKELRDLGINGKDLIAFNFQNSQFLNY
jgi:hypothetical protein